MSESTSTHVQREIFLRTLLGNGRTQDTAEQLSRVLTEESYLAGQILYEQGSAPLEIFFVVDGTVELVAEGLEPYSFEGRSVVGILDGMQERPHARTARASTDVRVLKVAMDVYWDILEDNLEGLRQSTMLNAGFLVEMERPLIEASLAVDLGPAPVWSAPDRPLELVEMIVVLRRAAIFEGASVQALAGLAQMAIERRWQPGAQLFAQGDSPDRLWMVARGSIDLHHDGRAIRRHGPGELVEGNAGLGGIPHPFTGITPTGAITLSLQREAVFDHMEQHFGLAKSLMRFMGAERQRVLQAVAQAGASPALRSEVTESAAR